MGVLMRLARMPRMRVLMFAVLARMLVFVGVLVRMLVAVRHIAMLVLVRVRMGVIVLVFLFHDQSLHCHFARIGAVRHPGSSPLTGWVGVFAEKHRT
jgi:hypothetical protein